MYARKYKNHKKFDIVTVSMLLPLLSSKSDIVSILKTSRKHLKKTGTLLIAVTHPCFDHYMRFGILGWKNVSTEFSGYFTSGVEYKTEHPMPSGSFVFDDFHWTLSDYFELIQSSGFVIERLNECPPDEKYRSDEKFWKRRNDYPTYLIFYCRLTNDRC